MCAFFNLSLKKFEPKSNENGNYSNVHLYIKILCTCTMYILCISYFKCLTMDYILAYRGVYRMLYNIQYNKQ